MGIANERETERVRGRELEETYRDTGRHQDQQRQKEADRETCHRKKERKKERDREGSLASVKGEIVEVECRVCTMGGLLC